ncbi:probable receptor-like protein kinase At1g49730 isoform X2 [Zingiber officinale]|uniref:probable receptor-like protein kinase At1g49730 isoform X2 n=1 Tax=Zingiber officinale TaxID=94328 RepID=UPI001C4B216F|nr:probable receptor-like protein kinase At1g49730 isoform X2 [Zingiber officinale]
MEHRLLRWPKALILRWRRRFRFLVFDYMENGRLKDYLHDPLKTPLNWRTRLQIAIDIAAALEYLQYFCEPPIYNVSISSNNIFLDENFVAKLLLNFFFSYLMWALPIVN